MSPGEPTDVTPARLRMVRRVRRTLGAAVVALLAALALLLFASTWVVLDRGSEVSAAGASSRSQMVLIAIAYVPVLLAASLLALFLARRAARIVETLFDQEDRLMSAVVHEIRNPLNRLLIVLEEGSLGVIDGKEAIDEARVCGQALATLISDLLQTARIMSGAASLPDENVRLDEVVRGLASIEVPGSPHLSYDTQPALVSGSPHLVRRAVINLVRNSAVHAYGGGPGEIRVRVDSTGIAVEDDGPGVTADRLDEIRYETPLARRTAGGGLGLELAGWVAEAHQGRLVVGNRPGGGFEARLDLPVRLLQAAEAGSESA